MAPPREGLEEHQCRSFPEQLDTARKLHTMSRIEQKEGVKDAQWDCKVHPVRDSEYLLMYLRILM
jgi:hypothetical protein